MAGLALEVTAWETPSVASQCCLGADLNDDIATDGVDVLAAFGLDLSFDHGADEFLGFGQGHHGGEMDFVAVGGKAIDRNHAESVGIATLGGGTVGVGVGSGVEGNFHGELRYLTG